MCLEACARCHIYWWGYRSPADFKIVWNKTKTPTITALLDTVFHYFQGLRRSRTIFAMPSWPLLCSWADAITFAALLLVYEFSLDYVIIWRVSVWDISVGKENGAVFEVSRLYLLSLSRLSTSNRPPYKWCVSGSRLIVGGPCAVDETQKVITIYSSN